MQNGINIKFRDYWKGKHFSSLYYYVYFITYDTLCILLMLIFSLKLCLLPVFCWGFGGFLADLYELSLYLIYSSNMQWFSNPIKQIS